MDKKNNNLVPIFFAAQLNAEKLLPDTGILS